MHPRSLFAAAAADNLVDSILLYQEHGGIMKRLMFLVACVIGLILIQALPALAGCCF